MIGENKDFQLKQDVTPTPKVSEEVVEAHFEAKASWIRAPGKLI